VARTQEAGQQRLHERRRHPLGPSPDALQRAHHRDRPGVVRDRVRQHEARTPLRLTDGGDLAYTAAEIVADEHGPVDAQLVEPAVKVPGLCLDRDVDMRRHVP
jgi:hypothetical protein